MQEQSGTYNPQVEAISPTPNEHVQDEIEFRTTKDDLLQQISRVDREIAKVEQSLQNLKKKEHELEEAASKPATQEVEEVLQPKHQSLAQKIYAENRRKAQAAHSLLATLGQKVDWPLYNQPSDTPTYNENKTKHQEFKPRLLEYFKKRHAEKEQRESYLATTYSKLMQEWLKKVEKVEGSQKRKGKEGKNREFFEKVFPELRKQREDKERFNRVGARIKSEADLEEIMDGLQEQEMEDKKMRSYAVIPPILLDSRQRKLCYSNKNGHILDMESEYKERLLINVWTNTEREIFKEKYLQHPKNFGVIASFLDRKSVQDCVQHYYLSKKTENYKQLLRKSRQRSRRHNPQKVTTNTDITLSTGVTTRLQREQQQKIGTTVSTESSSQASSTAFSTSSASITTTCVITTSVETTTCSTSSVSSVSTENPPSEVTSSSASEVTQTTTSTPPSITTPVVTTTTVTPSSDVTTTTTSSSDNATTVATTSIPTTSAVTTTSNASITTVTTSVVSPILSNVVTTTVTTTEATPPLPTTSPITPPASVEVSQAR